MHFFGPHLERYIVDHQNALLSEAAHEHLVALARTPPHPRRLRVPSTLARHFLALRHRTRRLPSKTQENATKGEPALHEVGAQGLEPRTSRM